MKASTLFRLKPILADLASRHQLWTWSAIFASMLVGILASLLHFHQQKALGEITEAITSIHLARIELSKGFLYVSLSGDPGAPFDRDEGLALLRQATGSLEEAMKTASGVMGDSEIADFKQRLDAFQSTLDEYSALAEPDARSKTNLRIAFHNLERLAEQVDAQSRPKLQELERSLNFEFGLTLSISIILLLGICVIVFFTNRAKERSDAAVLERERKLNELLNILPVGISILDKEEKVVFSNSTLQRILQLTSEEIASGAYRKRRYIGTDGTPMSPRQFASSRAIETGRPVFDVETGVVKEGGEIVWGNVSAVPVDFPDWNTVVVTTDITERKQAEQTQRAETERLNLALNAAQAGMWEWDLRTNENFWSEELWKVYGLEPHSREPSYEAWRETIHPEDRLHAEQAVQAAAHNLTELSTEWRVVDRDGSIRWLMSRGKPILDSKGQAGRFIGIVFDITERKRVEQNLQENEARARATINAIPDLMFRLDRSGVFLDYKANKDDLLEQSQSLVGLRNRDISPPEFADLIELMIEKTLATRQTQTFEYQLAVPHGGMREFEARMAPSGSNEVVAIVRDITKHKQVEEAIRLYNERLTSVVEIEHDLASVLDQELIYKALADGVQRLFPDITTIFISSFDAGREMIQAMYGIHEGCPVDVSSLPELKLAPDGQGTQSRVIRNAQPLIVEDHLKERLSPQKTTRIGSGAEDTQSAMYVPMIAQQKVLGLIQVQSLVPNRFGAGDVQALSLIANTAAVSLENAHLYQTAQVEIAERKQAEKKLYESEERYRLIAENSADVIWILDPIAGKFTYVSPSVKKLRGYTPEEVMAQTMEQALTPESLGTVGASLNDQLPAFIEGGGKPKSFVSEVDQPRKDGSIVHTEVTTTYLLNNRNTVEIIGISRDVTDRKRAEEQIRASEQKYRSLSMELEKRVEERTTETAAVRERLELAAQAAELGVWDWNIKTGELFWDERMYSVYQVGRDAFNGTIESFTNFVHPEDLPLLMELAQSVTLIGAQGVTQYRITCGDGSTRHIKAHGILQRDSLGEPSHIIGVAQDITPEKQAQETLELVNMELKRASRMKDEFLASMSHELRTPLTGILGLSEALQLKTYGDLSEKQLKTLKTIEESGRHLLDLINDILDLSKIEAGKLELQFEPCSISEICQASLQLTRGMAQKKLQTMRYTASPQPLIVQADTRRLKQILVNLLSNAVKFTREGGELGLEVEADEAGRRVNLTVWDKGIGIKPENMKMIFSPFTQIDSSLAREYSGTGLGLSLVQRLVKLHQGSVEVQSVFGEGSRFTVSLPWSPQNAAPITAAPQNPTAKDTGPLRPQQGATTPRVFIVDDNDLVLEMVGDYLEAKRYRVERASSAFELFERITEVNPDLIIMDIQMAGMSGLDAIRSIRSRAEPFIAKIPIIAVTALAMSGDRERCLNAGANEYMSKPVKLRELAAAIKNLIGKHHE